MIGARTSLAVVALLAGIGWRLELEWRGWAGTDWVSYFHWAIPAGALLFAGWLAVSGGARRRLALAVASLVLAAAAFAVLMHALGVIYSRWPPARVEMWLALGFGGGAFSLYPMSVWAVGHLCGAPVRFGHCALALALWVAAVPAAIAVLHVTDHIGGADVVHAIKSGVVIPLLLMALGLPFVGSRPIESAPSAR